MEIRGIRVSASVFVWLHLWFPSRLSGIMTLPGELGIHLACLVCELLRSNAPPLDMGGLQC